MKDSINAERNAPAGFSGNPFTGVVAGSVSGAHGNSSASPIPAPEPDSAANAGLRPDFGFEAIDSAPVSQTAVTPHPRAVGSPLPMGSLPAPHQQGDPARITASTTLGRLPAAPPSPPSDQPSNVQRAVNLMRSALPFVQKLLPLLDGNIVTAVSHLLTPTPQAPPPAQVNLAPLEDHLSTLQTQHRELRDQFVEHNSSLKRVEDQLEMVREATDRNTLEQQELLEDLKSVGSKINVVAFLALGLLAVSIVINVLLYLHIERVLP